MVKKKLKFTAAAATELVERYNSDKKNQVLMAREEIKVAISYIWDSIVSERIREWAGVGKTNTVIWANELYSDNYLKELHTKYPHLESNELSSIYDQEFELMLKQMGFQIHREFVSYKTRFIISWPRPAVC